MKKFIISTLLFLGLSVFSQSSSIQIRNSAGTLCLIKNLIPTSDGGKLIVAGYDTLSLIKVDQYNNLLWAKTIPNFFGGGLHVKLYEKNSNYYVSCQVPSTMSVNIYAFKFDVLGQLIFSKSLYLNTNNPYQPNRKSDFTVNNTDEMLINSSISDFMTLHKLDDTGHLIFGNKIDTDTITDNFNNYGFSSVICNDGGSIVTGMSDTSALITKLNQSGNFQWAKSYHISLFNNCKPQKIIKSIDSSYIVSGYSIDLMNGTYGVPFILKIDSVGNLIWYHEYTPVSPDEFKTSDLIELSNGNIIVYYENTSTLVETSSSGAIITKRQIVENESVSSHNSQIYITNFAWSVSATNSISQFSCIANDSIQFDITRTVTSNSNITNIYAKVEPYGTLYNFPLIQTNMKYLVEELCNMVGIKENHVNNNIKFYPNPTNSILNITDEQNQLQNTTIEIKNYLGQSVLLIPFSNQINISHLTSGMYFLTLQDKDSRKTVKIIKE